MRNPKSFTESATGLAARCLDLPLSRYGGQRLAGRTSVYWPASEGRKSIAVCECQQALAREQRTAVFGRSHRSLIGKTMSQAWAIARSARLAAAH